MFPFSTLPQALLLFSLLLLTSLPGQTTISGWAKIQNSDGQSLADVVIRIPAEPNDLIARTGADGRFELPIPEAYLELGMVPVEANHSDHHWINRREVRLQYLEEATSAQELILVFHPDPDYMAAIENFALDLHPILDKKLAVVQTNLNEQIASQPTNSSELELWLSRINRWRKSKAAPEAANFLFPIDFDQATPGQREARSSLMDGRTDQALAIIDQELAHAKQQEGADPQILVKQYQFAAQLALITGEISLGRDYYSQAISIADSPEILLGYADFHAIVGNREEVENQLLALLERDDLQAEMKAEIHAKLSNNYQWQQIPDKYILHARLALAIHQKLAIQYPQLDYFQDKLAQSHGTLGHQLTGNEQHEEALVHHSLVYEHAKISFEKHSSISFNHYNFAASCLWYGNALVTVGQKRRAKDIYREGLAVIQPLVDRSAYSIYKAVAESLADRLR